MIEGKSFLFIITIKYIYMIGGWGKFFIFIINEKNIIEGKSFFYLL